MSRREVKKNRRKTTCSVEQLDDRTLLSLAVLPAAVALAPMTQTAPAASPVSAKLVNRFEAGVDRLDRQFISRAQHFDNLLINRTAQLQRTFANNVSKADARVQQVLNSTGVAPQVNTASLVAPLNSQLGKFVATFNTQVAQFTTTFERQFANFVAPFEQSNSQFAIPVNAVNTNIRAATFAFSTGLSNAAKSAATVIENGATSLSSATSATPSNGSTTSGTTATSSTSAGTTSTTTNGIVTSQTQVFNTAVSQAFSSFNTAMQGVDSTLAQQTGSFTSQFGTTALSTLTSLNTSPFGTFAPTVGFVSGNGVTFTGTTGTTVPASGNTVGTTGSIGLVGTTGSTTVSTGSSGSIGTVGIIGTTTGNGSI